MKQTETKTDTEKNEAIVWVCSAGKKFCGRAEACSLFFSLIMLRCGGGSSGFGCEIPLHMGIRDVCVSRVVDYSSLVRHSWLVS